DKREENIKEKLASERKEKAEYAKKVGQLTMQVDWLKKKSEELECKRNIDRPNQAWSIDITYIPMKHGFLYLTAIIDWHSRCIVG
ncbi:MAG: hypothetical protein IIT46_09710, partial [Lachnospiraceae bacterium]|nr:hypothetical protein [Lachnospiraceae bacterium]